MGIRLGLRENLGQFALLVVVNAFVGAMVGMERSILPAIAEEEFHLAAKSAVLSFIAAFGIAKAIANLLAGRLADSWGRRPILLLGWALGLPVPFALAWAPRWEWIVAANVLLGASQGLAWSATVIMKIDLVGPRRRGLAMGWNEFAGYIAVAGAAFATGLVASRTGLRPQPFYLGIVLALAGFALSFAVRETRAHAALEASQIGGAGVADRSIFPIVQAGFANNLNDGMAWGLFPLLFAASRIPLSRIGVLAAIYPATWGLLQIGTGALSDRIGRRGLVAGGMIVQAAGIALVASGRAFGVFASGAVLLGVGTAMVYPTLLAWMGDVIHPSRRASALGTYRFWRDAGYVAGALVAGIAADLLGVRAAVWLVAGITAASGLVALVSDGATPRRGVGRMPG